MVRQRALNNVYYLYMICFQLFYSFFKSLVGKEVVVELKNDLRYVSNEVFCDLLNKHTVNMLISLQNNEANAKYYVMQILVFDFVYLSKTFFF